MNFINIWESGLLDLNMLQNLKLTFICIKILVLDGLSLILQCRKTKNNRQPQNDTHYGKRKISI